MRFSQYTPKSERMSLLIKTLGLSASTAIFLTGNSAFAANGSQTSTDVQSQLSPKTTLAQDTQSEANDSDAPRFTCQFVDGEYSVMYHPESQPGQTYPWATPSAMGGGWSAERRCNEISRRLEFYRSDGLLEMQTGVENNYDIICVTTQKNSACQIVLTVPPGQDPQQTRDLVFENLTVADSGEQTDAVATFVEGGRSSELVNQVLNEGLSALGMGKTPIGRSADSINLRPFLDPADGGTGTQLRGGSRVRSNRRLDPNNFR
ncbi:COP23 domain-containing protein [Coleofasciculus sp. LEGE 07092]|uniref:COP23 domain-containing protein n=2 Tax=unclassified Coleofasciculus TaxID=2692782 RepID=UPI001D142FC2|nr:COP23 domain-containing protein [Coleofasciculus sp. LEGE 07092]